MHEHSPASRPLTARVALFCTFLADGLGVGAWAAGIATLKLNLGLSDSALSAALFAFAAGSIVAMPSAGWLAARFKAHRVMVVAGLAFGLALLLPGMATSLRGVAAAALLLGGSKGLLDISMNAHATTVQRIWGTAIMSSFHAAFSLGGLVGSAGMGVLLGAQLGLQTGLAVTTALIIGLIIAAAVLSRGWGPANTAKEGGLSPPFALPSRAVLGIGILCFLCMLIEGGLADWSGVYLTSVAGVSAAGAAAGYAAFSIMMAAGRLTGDALVRRYGGGRVLRMGALLGTLGMAIALAVPQGGALGFGLVGLGIANVVPLLFTAAGQSGKTSPGVGIAMAASVGYAGFLLGPPVIGYVADAIGLRTALLILLAAAAVIAAAPRRVATV